MPKQQFVLFSLPLCLVFLALGCILNEPPSKIEDASKQAIQQVLDAQVAAWNKGDLKGFMAGYWQSPELSFFSGNSKTKSWDATLERYQKRYQSEGKEMGKLAFSEVQIELIGGDSAWIRGRFTLELSKEKPTGLFTLIVKKVGEGWRIVHDHTST